MRKTIEWFDGETKHALELDNTVTWMIYYKETFGHDIVPDLAPIINTVIRSVGELLTSLDIPNITKIANSKQKDSAKGAAIMDELAKKIDPDALAAIVFDASAIESVTVAQIAWAMAKTADDATAGFIPWSLEQRGLTTPVMLPAVFSLVTEGWFTEKSPLLEGLRAMLAEPNK